MHTTFLVLTFRNLTMNSPEGYLVGAIISFLILGYLIYSLVKPEKF